jgi:RHS repeat-associated protein
VIFLAWWLILAKIVKVIVQIKKTIDLLQALSSGQLVRALVVSKLLGVVKNSISQRGIPINELDKFNLREQAEEWATRILKDDPVSRLNLNPLDLLTKVDDQYEKLRRGAAVSNGPDAVSKARRTADPILLYRGEFERQIVDLQINAAGFDFQFIRTYRSGVEYMGPIGLNWDHNHNLRLRQEGELILIKLTGQLSEERFVRHPRFGESAAFSYYVPPHGVHDVIVHNDDNSFTLMRPQGIAYRFEPTDQPGEHRIKRIEDRFGNFLEFRYSQDDQKLKRIFINSTARSVALSYNNQGFLSKIEDHAGRIVTYAYDDFGYLEYVRGPAFSHEKPLHVERYEYDRVGHVRKLVRVFNEEDRILVENQYDSNDLSDYFGHVIRQTEGRGETSFFYENITGEFDPAIPTRDLPSLKVSEYHRNGHQIEHILNEFGNELMTRERFIGVCDTSEIITCFRYNADGAIISKLSSQGVLTQSLFERDHIADFISWPDIDPVIGDITLEDRMNFGNLLATVTRGRRIPIDQIIRGFGPDFWNQFPVVKAYDRPEDIVIKYKYDPKSQLLVSKSDPRHTSSADPLHVESAEAGQANFNPRDSRYTSHQNHLTRFEYGPAPHYEHKHTIFPKRTYPSQLDSNEEINDLVENYAKYDNNGRLLEKIDSRKYSWFNEYYRHTTTDDSGVNTLPDAKEGYLRRQLMPHIDWTLNRDTPNILEIRKNGTWREFESFFLSKGTPADYIKLQVEGVRITLFQSSNLEERTSRNTNVEVTIDGIRMPSWNQSIDSRYIVASLPSGFHSVELSSNENVPFVIGRIQTHVSIEYDLDDLGNLIGKYDARGHVTVNEVDAFGFLKKTVFGPPLNPSIVHYKYDPSGRVLLEHAEWRDEDGQLKSEKAVITRFSYNISGSLLSQSIQAEAGGDIRVSHYKYDVEENIVQSVNGRGIITRFEYDELSRRIRLVRGACTSSQSILTTIYDLDSNILEERNPIGARSIFGHIDSLNVIHSGRDTHGRVKVKTDPSGNLLITDYDALNNPTVARHFHCRLYDNTYHLLSRQTIEYDEHGDTIKITNAIFENPIQCDDPINAPDREFEYMMNSNSIQYCSTEFYLDANGNQLAVRNADGGIIRRYYDGQNRPFYEIDEEGRRTFRIFDGTGNLIRNYIFEPSVGSASDSNTSYETFVYTYQYDEQNHLTARIDPLGNRWEQKYDTLGNRTVDIDPLGNLIRYKYNASGERVERIEEKISSGTSGGPFSQIRTTYEYDEIGNPSKIINAAQQVSQFTYDALDNLTKIRYPGTSEIEVMKYDPAGNLVYHKDMNGLIKHIQYDLLNRPVSIRADTSNMNIGNSLSALSATFASFDYDPSGKLIRHENDYCISEIKRNSQGLPIIEKISIKNIAGAPPTSILKREFSKGGRITRLTYPSGRQLEYLYNHKGQVISFKNLVSPAGYPGRAANSENFVICLYKYVGNRLDTIEMGNGLNLSISYDGGGAVLDRTLRGGGNIIWRMQRLRDAARLTRIENSLTLNGSRSRWFSFDSIRQLIYYSDTSADWIDPVPLGPSRIPIDPLLTKRQLNMNAIIETSLPLDINAVFHYDPNGNRTLANEPHKQAINYSNNISDQYDTVNNIQWTYDNGNLTFDGKLSFYYDLDNALQEISDNTLNVTQVTYYRDAIGQVVAEVTPTNKTFFLNDERKPLVEIFPTDQVEHTIDPNSGYVIHSALEGEDYWHIRDDLGSVRVVTDGTGGIISMPTYRPYGEDEDLRQVDLNPIRFGFAGMWFTPSIDFLHSEYRTYRADIGRYLQKDPLGYIDGLNLYTYVGNNPVDLFDRTGLTEEEIVSGSTPTVEESISGWNPTTGHWDEEGRYWYFDPENADKVWVWEKGTWNNLGPPATHETIAKKSFYEGISGMHISYPGMPPYKHESYKRPSAQYYSETNRKKFAEIVEHCNALTCHIQLPLGRPPTDDEIDLYNLDKTVEGLHRDLLIDLTLAAAPLGTAVISAPRRFATYAFVNESAAVVYIGRASGHARYTAQKVMDLRINRGHHILRSHPNLTPKLLAEQGNRAANLGAEDVFYNYYKMLGERASPPYQMLNKTNPLSELSRKILGSRRRIQAYAEDLLTPFTPFP